MRYGRFGIVNFQNQLDARGNGLEFSWRRTGPGSAVCHRTYGAGRSL
jgi:hypothetical protein